MTIDTKLATELTVASSSAFDKVIAGNGAALVSVTPAEMAERINVENKTRSVRDFGAACDGSTDDSAAVDSALTWVIANNGSLVVPGICRLASAVTATMAAEDHISIYGVGSRNSGFLVDNATGGIDFDGSAVRSHSVVMRDIGFFPNSDGAGYPFKIRGLEGGAQDNRAAELVNVHVGPVDDTVAYSFSEGPSVTGLFRPFFSNLIVTQGSASTTKMAHIMDISGCYKPAWGGECYLKATAASGGADYGLIQSGDTPEDMTCLPITINGADIGWLIQNTGREPGGFIIGHHINSKQKNIVIDGLKYATIFAPLLYADTSSTPFIDIELINADGVQILDPIFRGNSVDDRRHVKADPTAPDVVRNIKVRAFGLYATVTVAPFYIGSEVDNFQLELPQYVSGVDFASYPTELVEVETGAENIIVKTPTETRAYDDTATNGPLLKYVRRSASPATSDVLAQQEYIGNDSAGNEAIYAAIRALIRDATNTSEDGALQLYAMMAGTLTQAISIEAPGTNQAALYLYTDRAGTKTLQRVKVGAADSGGTGQRLLTVDN